MKLSPAMIRVLRAAPVYWGQVMIATNTILALERRNLVAVLRKPQMCWQWKITDAGRDALDGA